VQALESFFDEFEQYVAKAGRDVVAVTVDFVYVSQKVIAAAADAVNAEAHAFVSAFAHPRAKGARKAPRRMRDRLTIVSSI
jgi:ABC-type branched-subunit amino acid transport system substrate-binding protein